MLSFSRYSCSVCESLQNATRKTKMVTIPEVKWLLLFQWIRVREGVFSLTAYISISKTLWHSLSFHCMYSKVLNVQLMRFKFDPETWVKEKSFDKITFPETMDIAAVMDSNESLLYDLTAVLVHSGDNLETGHYLAYVLHPEWVLGHGLVGVFLTDIILIIIIFCSAPLFHDIEAKNGLSATTRPFWNLTRKILIPKTMSSRRSPRNLRLGNKKLPLSPQKLRTRQSKEFKFWYEGSNCPCGIQEEEECSLISFSFF